MNSDAERFRLSELERHRDYLRQEIATAKRFGYKDTKSEFELQCVLGELSAHGRSSGQTVRGTDFDIFEA